jgi:hypothetical protein
MRLRTWGAEWGHLSGDPLDLGNPPSGGVSVQSSVKRSGGYAYALTGTNPRISFQTLSPAPVAGRNYYWRAYVRWTATPAADFTLLALDNAGTVQLRVKLTPSGALRVIAGPTDFGVGAVVAAGSWHAIEVRVQVSPSSWEVRVDGAPNYMSASGGAGLGANGLGSLTVGDSAASPGAVVVYVDDLAVNDDQGTLQNSWAASPEGGGVSGGHVALLRPVADAQVGSWTGGAGGTTSLWDALDNVPPVGAAAGGNTAQIQTMAINTSADEYRATLPTYAAGIPDADTLVVGHAIVCHAEIVATGFKNGSFSVLSNPAQGAFDTFIYGYDLGAAGTWPANWGASIGTAVDLSATAKSAAAVLAVRKTSGVTTANGRSAVAGLGLLVEYNQAAPVPDNVLEGASAIYYGTVPMTAAYAGTVKDWPP